MSRKPSKAQKALDELLGIVTDMTDTNKSQQEVIPIDENSTDVVTYEAIPQEDAQERKKQKKDIEDDYDLARNTLRNLIGNGEIALNKMIELMGIKKEKNYDDEYDDDVTMIPTPRTFEVTSNLIRNLAEVSKDLLEIQKSKQVLDNPKNLPLNEEKTKIIEKSTNNIFFNGSTAELNKALEDLDKNDDN